MRLWNYVSTFSNLSGERLHQIYSKLKQEQEEEAGSSHANGSISGSFGREGDLNHFTPFCGQRAQRNHLGPDPFQKGHDTAKFETLKRRRENESHLQIQVPSQRPLTNGTRLSDPNSLGILGAAPRHVGNGRPQRIRQTGLPPRQGFSSGIK